MEWGVSFEKNVCVCLLVLAGPIQADKTECASWRLRDLPLSLLWVFITPRNLKVSAFNCPGTF